MLPTAGSAVTVKDVIRIAVSEIRIGLVSGSALTSPLKVPVNLHTATHEQILAEGKYWQRLLVHGLSCTRHACTCLLGQPPRVKVKGAEHKSNHKLSA